ncbi:hypothetical protein RI367_005423 [Sorochytrium milnesiophthora]
MASLTTSQIVLLTVQLTLSAEVLLRIVTLTKFRWTATSQKFYAFWASSILAHISATVMDGTPAITVNLGYRVVTLLFYPVMYCSFLLILVNRLKVVDVAKSIRPWHVNSLIALSAAVSMMGELMRLCGQLILNGVMVGTLAPAPAIVCTSVVFFSLANICIYLLTLSKLRSSSAIGSHAKKIITVILINSCLDVYELALALSGNFITAYNQHSALFMVKMRLELEIWEDFLRHVGRKPSEAEGSGAHSSTTKASAKPTTSALNSAKVLNTTAA